MIDKPHPITKGIKITGKELVLYTHHLKPVQGAEVVLNLDNGEPALVVGTAGKGRVAAVVILPFGKAPTGKELYFETEAWQQLIANTMQWLMRKR